LEQNVRVDRAAVSDPLHWGHERNVRKRRRGRFLGGLARQTIHTLPGPRNGSPHRLQRCSLDLMNRAQACPSELFPVRASSVETESAWLRHGRSYAGTISTLPRNRRPSLRRSIRTHRLVLVLVPLSHGLLR
jgi:hypothetical protein